MCSPTIAHWRHLANMIKLVLPSAYPSPQSKRQIERFSHFLHRSLKIHCRQADWRHLLNTIELVHPSAHSSPEPKRQIDRFSRFCTAHGRKCLYLTIGAHIHQNCPFPWGSGPPWNTWFLGSMRAQKPNGTSIGSASFAQMTTECSYTLQWFASFPLKIVPSHWAIWTPCNTWFLGLTRVLIPNGISIASAVFAGLTSVTDLETDRQTDEPRYSVGNNRRHVHT